MYIIKDAVGLEFGEENSVALLQQAVPADMGDAYCWILRCKPPYAGWEPTEACVASEFLALFGEKLKAQANTEYRSMVFADKARERRHQLALNQISHSITERAYAGQNQLFRTTKHLGVGAYHRIKAKLFDGTGD
jgi:hypothetical protein